MPALTLICFKVSAIFFTLLSSIYKTKIYLTNFMCQTFFDRVNLEFFTNLLKIPNLHGEKYTTFIKENLVVKMGLILQC